MARCFVLLVLCVGLAACASCSSLARGHVSTQATSPRESPDEPLVRQQLPPGSWEAWDINGTTQWLLFRAPRVEKHNTHDEPHTVAGVLLFVHGGPGMPMSVFSSVFDAPYLEHFRVVHWDQRGAGRSTTAAGPSDELTIATYVADAAAVAARLRRRWPALPLVVAGHSWGSIVANELARSTPQHVDHLVLMGTVVDVPAMQRVQFDQLVERGVPPDSIGPPPWDSLSTIVPVARAIADVGGSLGRLAPDFARIVAESVDYSDADRRLMGQGSAETLRRLWPVVATWSGPATDGPFAMPVTLIHGARDLSTPLSLVQEYYAKIESDGGKALFVRPGAAHFVMWEHNVEVARLLFERVSECAVATGCE